MKLSSLRPSLQEHRYGHGNLNFLTRKFHLTVNFFQRKGSVFYSQKDINLRLPLSNYWQWLPSCTGCIKTECMYILCLMNLGKTVA